MLAMSLHVTFLGTSGAVPTTQRSPSALLVNREGERLLFDCGEGTQRQMMECGTGFSLSAIFLTHLHGDHVYGLPGLLETLSFNERTDPLTIYAPPGGEDDVETFITQLGGDPAFPVHVAGAPRSGEVFAGEGYTVTAFPVEHRTTAIGYALTEDDRKGRFDRERAEELGVPVGPKFSTLHEGDPVELEDGTVVEPAQVVGPPRPGRKLVYSGDTRPTDRTIEEAQGADLLVHDGTFADDRAGRARKTGHSTAREAGRVAAEAGVKRLAIVHLSSRYGNKTSAHERQAREVFSGTVLVPDDGTEIDVPYPDA